MHAYIYIDFRLQSAVCSSCDILSTLGILLQAERLEARSKTIFELRHFLLFLLCSGSLESTISTFMTKLSYYSQLHVARFDSQSSPATFGFAVEFASWRVGRGRRPRCWPGTALSPRIVSLSGRASAPAAPAGGGGGGADGGSGNRFRVPRLWLRFS